jgi:hypothetical protein
VLGDRSGTNVNVRGRRHDLRQAASSLQSRQFARARDEGLARADRGEKIDALRLHHLIHERVPAQHASKFGQRNGAAPIGPSHVDAAKKAASSVI